MMDYYSIFGLSLTVITILLAYVFTGMSAIMVLNHGDLSGYNSDKELLIDIIRWPYVLRKSGY